MVRHLITIDDLSEREILGIFDLADSYLATMTHVDRPWRIRGGRKDADQFQLATLFYEASTRTRFSFESAMGRLGGQVLSSADPKTTSAAKGETLADTIRVVQNYADVVVIRHPAEGAARIVADFAEIPIINAGDGGHEHPTQTLCDLYTLRREKGSLDGLHVALWGDLKNGRTVHSLAFGLARFGARIVSMAAPGFELPDHVVRRLKQDYDCEPITAEAFGQMRHRSAPVDAAYIAPQKPHQRSLFTNVGGETAGELIDRVGIGPKLDALYVTRLQRERLVPPEGHQPDARAGDGRAPDAYDVVDHQFLRENLDAHSSVMHPLPRVDELATEIDTDERAVYFKQAAYGVPVRMALLATVLGVRSGILADSPPDHRYPVTQSRSLVCRNSRCITANEAERRYLRPTFSRLFVDRQVVHRCIYCEHEQTPGWVAISAHTAIPNLDLAHAPDSEALVFDNERDAIAAGFATTS
jgi:aspartate carbamoyltransferase catalytic subunit